MTSTATIPRGAPQTMVPPSLVLPSTLVVPRRSSVVNAGARSSNSAEVSPVPVATSGGGGGASDGRWSTRKAIEPPSNHHTASLKTLSCDLSELLVRNLSLRRSETSERQPCQQQQQHQQPLVDKIEEQCCVSGVPPSSGGGGGTSNANRNSLCDTFPSVNKFIKLKRVSSDGSNLSRLSVVSATATTTAAGGNYTKIVEQPSSAGGARFKRVEISVRQGRTTPDSEESKRGTPVNQRRTSSGGGGGAGVQPSSSESDAEEEEEEEIYSFSGVSSAAGGSTSSVRKSVIVNQLDQVDENCPLLVANGSNNGATVTLRKKDSSLVYTTRKPIVATVAGESATSLRKEQTCTAVPKVVLRRRRPDRPSDKEVLVSKRRSLPWPLGAAGTLLSRASLTEGAIEEGREVTPQRSSLVQETGRSENRHSLGKSLRHSWNAPGYDILEEDPGGEDLQKDFASIIHNLAGLRNHHLANGTHESVSLLEQHSPQIVPSRATRPTSLGSSGQGRRGGRPSSWMQSSPMVTVPAPPAPRPETIPTVPSSGGGTGATTGAGNLTETSSPHTGSLSAPVPRKRRFEAFLKNLVGRRPSKEPPSHQAPPPPPLPPAVLLPSPEIKISKSPSEHNLAELERNRLHVSTTSLSSVHQKLWSVVPLLKRDVSCNSLASPKTTPLLMFDGYQSPANQVATGTKLTAGSGGSGKLGGPAAGVGGLRKCETVLALTGSSASQTLEPIRPLNRLRNCASVATCSRCSSLLSLAAAGSRYSLNASNGAFVPVASGPSEPLSSSQHQLPTVAAASRALRKKVTDTGAVTGGAGGGGGSKRKHVGNLLRLTSSTRRSSSSSSSSSSAASSPCSSSTPSSSSSSSASTPNGAGSPAASVSSKTALTFVPSPSAGSQLLIPVPALGGSPVGATNVATTTTTTTALTPTVKFTCKLCLGEFSAENLTRIAQCDCSFCTECMTAYIEFEISEGAYEVSCPDAMCPAQGIITMAEISALASPSLVEKHHRYRLNREVELDRFRTWCPKAGCETICRVGGGTPPNAVQQTSSSSCADRIVTLSPSSSSMPSPCAVHCHTCREDFCSGCKKAWHPLMSCEENSRRLAVDGQADALGIPFDNDLIKCCPMCTVPIEKDEGCAQMMCKRCKHVFCWYCLASLDDDFLLRHYDKGPCKNKLGHSRASVVWHRAQVIGIFAGFGILLLVASPLLLLAAPCIVCCKCRICSGAAKLEETEVDYDDVAVALHSSNPR
ncbi:mucin-19 [Anopheles aquasalis]|uniref:mucin-19 n=1 Tax=Anopheles aquasalis TaxID=42839 RepID=UPI00215A878D|nr:mucin-19 [Anopheles aquasalis]XP_050091827.1 mucin-19 [Anopheles aquasalis]XP_050091829.1 mucin-19 [Anopheles aquasalis]